MRIDMMRWDEKEFDRVASATRLSVNMITACRDVLVNGMSGAEAARQHNFLPQPISRSLKGLRDVRAELRVTDREDAKAIGLIDVPSKRKNFLKTIAREAAQSIKGSEWIIRESKPGTAYEGTGVVKLGGYFVQDIGRLGILHDLKNLDIEPTIGKRLEINYALDGKGVVSEVQLEKGTREKER